VTAWKIERWLAEVYKEEGALIDAWGPLSARELVIVACATLDVALAEILSLRFVDDANEATDFLGADDDGRAPAGSFGARIQLAYLLGIIPKDAVQTLRALKKLRNLMAHRVGAGLLGEKEQACLEQFRSQAQAAVPRVDNPPVLEAIIRESRSSEQAASFIILVGCLAIHSALYHDMQGMKRLPLYSPRTAPPQPQRS